MRHSDWHGGTRPVNRAVMVATVPALVFVGFGEAAMAFADGMVGPIVAYDRKTDVGASRSAKLDNYTRAGVTGAQTNLAAVAGAPLILSLVTANRSLAAARDTARGIAAGALYCDMNSVAPDTKRAAAAAIEAAGGRYVDVAVMAPVHPLCRSVPLLISGPDGDAAAVSLTDAGFGDIRVISGPVGAAAAVKMIRSVLVKGLEALTTECVIAADRAGVMDDVIDSLDANWPGTDWRAKADYNLGRMMMHGVRRADEMAEVVKTLDALGTGSGMARATAERQRTIGQLGLAPDQPLVEKIYAVLGNREWASA